MLASAPLQFGWWGQRQGTRGHGRVSTRREDAAASLSPDTAGRPLPRGPRDLGITVLPPLAGGGRERGPSAPLGTFACGQLRAEHRGPGARQEAAGPRATPAKGGVPTGGQALGGGRYSRRCGPPAGSCVMGLLRTGPAGHPSPLGTPAKLAPPPAAPPPPSSHLCACRWLPPPRQASPLEFSVLLSLPGLPSWPTFPPPPCSSSSAFPVTPGSLAGDSSPSWSPAYGPACAARSGPSAAASPAARSLCGSPRAVLTQSTAFAWDHQDRLQHPVSPVQPSLVLGVPGRASPVLEETQEGLGRGSGQEASGRPAGRPRVHWVHWEPWVALVPARPSPPRAARDGWTASEEWWQKVLTPAQARSGGGRQGLCTLRSSSSSGS